MNKNDLIFIVEDDFDYGKLVLAMLTREKFNNVFLYTDEKECLNNMTKTPKTVIINYHLKSMTGLQLIQKAKAIYPNFFAILLSGEFHIDIRKVNDERFIQYVDRFIIKGMDDIKELVDTLTHSYGAQSNNEN